VTGPDLQVYHWGDGAAGLGILGTVCRMGRTSELYIVT